MTKADRNGWKSWQWFVSVLIGIVYAYCQMTNHYHLLIETVDGNLAGGMRHLNLEKAVKSKNRHVAPY